MSKKKKCLKCGEKTVRAKENFWHSDNLKEDKTFPHRCYQEKCENPNCDYEYTYGDCRKEDLL